MQSSPTILLAIICGFLLILGGMAAVAVFVIRKDKERSAKIAQSLGLTAVTDVEPFLQKIAYVHDIQHPEMYRVEGVFHRRHASGGDVYLFGLHRREVRARTISQPSGSSKIHYFPLELSALAFVSPSWKLPRFTAMPRLAGGKLAELGNALAENAMDIKHEIIKFPHVPNLDERYLIATSELPPSHVRPSDGFLRVLAAHPNLRLHVGGDTLTLSYMDSNSQTPDEEKMKLLHKIGMALARELG